MDKPFLGGIVVAVAVLVGAGAFVMAPRMQSPEAKVFSRAGMNAERARRLLHRFSQNQERIDALLEALRRSGISGDIDVGKLLEDEENRAAVEEEDARLQEMSRADAGRQGALEKRFLKFAYGKQWQQYQKTGRPRLGTNVAQMTRSLSEGLRQRQSLLAENKRLLEQALYAVNQALGESVGGVSGAEDVQINRLKGVMLYCLAQARRHDAGFLGQEAARLRAELVALGLEARRIAKEKNLVAASGIDVEIAAAERDEAEAQTLLAELQASVEAVQSDIAEVKSRIAVARAVADEARTAMDVLETRGVDLAEPDGFERFADEFNRLAPTYREAISELRRLESGALLNARIDSSGDLLHGRYVPAEGGQPIRFDRGLAGLESDLSGIQLERAAAEQAVDLAGTHREALRARKGEYEKLGAQAAARLEAVGKAADDVYTEFSRLYEKADEAESQALRYFRESVKAFTAAGRLAAARSNDAGTAVAGLSPEARERSIANAVAKDAWLEQRYRVDAADAQIELGRFYYTISEEAKRTADVLDALPEDIAPANADPATWRDKHEQARSAAIEILQTAYDSLQRTRGRLGGHWTVAAEAAAAASLLALLGEENLRDIAVATYEEVVTGQEDQPHMQPYVNRLRVLRTQ